MSDFHGIPGSTVAHSLDVTPVSQGAFDLARADLPEDQPCVLFTLRGPRRHDARGVKLPTEEVRRLISVLSPIVDEDNMQPTRPAVAKNRNTPLPARLAPRVCYLRTQIPMTQRELALQSRCSEATIRNVEHGSHVPFNRTVARIAVALSVARASLIDLAEQERQTRRGKNKEQVA